MNAVWDSPASHITSGLHRVMAWCLCFTLFHASTILADEIILKNGDRITGQVTSIEGGVLTLKTDYSDPIKVRTEKIYRISTDQSVEVHLESGEILKGQLRSLETGETLVDSSNEREATVIQWEKITSLNPPPPKWKGSITAGAAQQSGNTDRLDASVGAQASRRTARDRVSLRFLYNYAEDDDGISARNTFGAAKYDYFFTKRFYGYLAVELFSDEFKDLKLRTVVGPGVGYQIWDAPRKSLLVEAGLSYFSEDLDEGEDDEWITARLAASLMLQLFGSVIFTDDVVMYPSLEQTGEYQLRNEAAIRSPLASGWSLKLSNILERDSDPPDDVEKNDWYWILGVQYDFM